MPAGGFGHLSGLARQLGPAPLVFLVANYAYKQTAGGRNYRGMSHRSSTAGHHIQLLVLCSRCLLLSRFPSVSTSKIALGIGKSGGRINDRQAAVWGDPRIVESLSGRARFSGPINSLQTLCITKLHSADIIIMAFGSRKTHINLIKRNPKRRLDSRRDESWFFFLLVRHYFERGMTRRIRGNLGK